jgi:hypothetical protein
MKNILLRQMGWLDSYNSICWAQIGLEHILKELAQEADMILLGYWGTDEDSNHWATWCMIDAPDNEIQTWDD